MTFEQAFLNIKEKFGKADASKVSNFSIQVTLIDEDCGGTFYAELKDGKLAIEPYDYFDNDVALNITKSALLSVIAGRISLDKAIANGNAYVHGDASKIADLKSTIKKTPAKKTQPKKASAKKSVAKSTSKATTAKKSPAKKASTTKPTTSIAKATTKAITKI